MPGYNFKTLMESTKDNIGKVLILLNEIENETKPFFSKPVLDSEGKTERKENPPISGIAEPKIIEVLEKAWGARHLKNKILAAFFLLTQIGEAMKHVKSAKSRVCLQLAVMN